MQSPKFKIQKLNLPKLPLTSMFLFLFSFPTFSLTPFRAGYYGELRSLLEVNYSTLDWAFDLAL